MASSEQAKTFTVPVGMRLSHGIELELLVAYLYKSDILPSEADGSSLPPILRIDDDESIDDAHLTDAVHVRNHIRATLRDHGMQVHDDSELYFNDDGIPLHLEGIGSWDVAIDASVVPGVQESALPKEYKWFNLELRSPAFWDLEHVYDETTFVVNLLKSKYRVRVNASCGFHVHVANGVRYFDPTTLKRAGAFLWAADPMLSRLHAPWRRVHEYSTSIRYRSRLARGAKVQPAEIQASIDAAAERLDERSGGTLTMDPLPVLPWSDTSMGEVLLGGREQWEEYARERVQRGPWMEVPGRPPSRAESELSTSDLGSSSSSSPYSSSDSEPDNPGNLSGKYDRNFQKVIMTDRMRARCYEEYGHDDIRSLSPNQQYNLLSLENCERMYGHTDIESLSHEEFEALLSKCDPFLQTLRTSYNWDEKRNRFVINHRITQIGMEVSAPPGQNYDEKKEKSLAVVRLQELVEEQDRGEIPDDEVPDYESDDDEDISGAVDDLEKFLYNRLEQLMEQPTFPLHCVDSLVAEMKRLKEVAGLLSAPGSVAPTPPPVPADEHSNDSDEGCSAATTDSSGDFKPPASNALDEAFGTQGSPELRGGDNELESSMTSSNYDPSKDPAFFNFASSSPHSSGFINPLSSFSPSSSNPNKLQPHDAHTLPSQYIQTISQAAYLDDRHWERISWLPDPSGCGRPDPVEHHARHSIVCAGPSCTEHVVTTTRAGIAALLGTDSAAALAALLVSPTKDDEIGDRLNYNFVAYAPFTLGSLGAIAEKRTIEFREAGGSLDPEWIVTWARICVGIMRFCRDSDPGEFTRVLERVVRQEERSRCGRGVRYDVCDLLEDMCLFSEAEIVRRRERELGPPR
ncbi:hypothetical protein RRF57_005712 [Xylaria bambusicola]|uniref:Amidoligase enzyme n=1 Tax=Xylaria bambusicola TaxID=326684 RepID=A0AAN7UK78_9PEZI